MIDTTTRETIKVRIDRSGPPYISVLESQLGELRKLLDEKGIPYAEDEYAISLNGGPESSMIFLAYGADIAAIQAILDGEHP